MYSHMRSEVNRRKLTHIAPAISRAFRCTTSRLKRRSSASPTKVPDRMARIGIRHVNETKLLAFFSILCFVQIYVKPLYALVRVSIARAELDFKLLEMTIKEKREREEGEAEDDECDYAFCEMDGMCSG